MRVALFFDGKNFYSGLKDQAPNHIIDFNKMSDWIVERVEGSHLWGAYYYTGVESGSVTRNEGQSKLSNFLDMLELQPGYFVKRFPRKTHIYNCNSCGSTNRFTEEKEVDTTMVADMLRLAAVNAFDILVLMSGDADHTPAVEGVRAIGKQVYVATWGKAGLSARIRKAAFDHIDLLTGMNHFGHRADGFPSQYQQERADEYNEIDENGEYEYISEEELDERITEEMMDVLLHELERAEQTFQSGYVGMNYFIKRWQSEKLEDSPIIRRRMIEILSDEGRLEIYDAPDGNKALRRTQITSYE